MTDNCCGIFVLYRWPKETPWSEAPTIVQELVSRAKKSVLYMGIWQGHHRGREDAPPWHPEVRTAVTLVQVEGLRRQAAESLQAMFAQGPSQCRDGKSTVYWVADRKLSRIGTCNKEKIPELLDLYVHGEVQLLEGLLSCVHAFQPRQRSGAMVRRRHNDVPFHHILIWRHHPLGEGSPSVAGTNH